jgi:hypothetical protein
MWRVIGDLLSLTVAEATTSLRDYCLMTVVTMEYQVIDVNRPLLRAPSAANSRIARACRLHLRRADVSAWGQRDEYAAVCSHNARR